MFIGTILAKTFSGTYNDEISRVARGWLKKHPSTNKACIIFNHFARTAEMVAFCTVLPFSFATNCGIALVTRYFYRITSEGECIYHYALPSCFGAWAVHMSQPAFIALISGVGLQNLSVFALSFIQVFPVVVYAAYIVQLTNQEVNLNRQGSCCV